MRPKVAALWHPLASDALAARRHGYVLQWDQRSTSIPMLVLRCVTCAGWPDDQKASDVRKRKKSDPQCNTGGVSIIIYARNSHWVALSNLPSTLWLVPFNTFLTCSSLVTFAGWTWLQLKRVQLLFRICTPGYGWKKSHVWSVLEVVAVHGMRYVRAVTTSSTVTTLWALTGGYFTSRHRHTLFQPIDNDFTKPTNTRLCKESHHAVGEDQVSHVAVLIHQDGWRQRWACRAVIVWCWFRMSLRDVKKFHS